MTEEPDRASNSRGVPSATSQDAHSLFLTVARVVRVHGTGGELACEIVTEFPQRFRKTRTLYFAPSGETTGGEPPVPRTIIAARIVPRGHGTQLILKVEGSDDRDAAAALRGALIQVPEAEARKLPRGRYYWHEIIGLCAQTVDGRELGTVKDILETGANDVYVVQTGHGELLIPAIKQVVKEIAPERGIMTIELLPGLEDVVASEVSSSGAGRRGRHYGAKALGGQRRPSHRRRRSETAAPLNQSAAERPPGWTDDA